MGIGSESDLATYSSGLGMLAGNTIRSSADMGIPWSQSPCCTVRDILHSASTPMDGNTKSRSKWRPEKFLEVYNNRDQFADLMRHCIALNGSFFNTHRKLQQYIQKAYFF